MDATNPASRAARERELRELLRGALEAQERLGVVYAELAASPDPEGPREERAAALREERRQLAQRLGLAILEASLSGAELRLDWPAHSSSPQPHEPTGARLPPGGAAADPPAELPSAEAPASRHPAQALIESVRSSDPVEVTPRPQQARSVAPAPAPAADPDALRRLAQRGLGPNWQEQEPRTVRESPLQLLHTVMDTIGPPFVIDHEETLEEEARRIARESDRLERWLPLDRDSQQLLLSYAAAKARYLQERAREGSVPQTAVSGLDPAFRTMNRFSKDYRPGFVWGLSRSHTPKRGHWLEDAEQYWQELLDRAGRSPKVDTNPERALARLGELLDRTPDEAEVREGTLDVLASGVSATDPRLLKLLEPYVDALTGRSLKAVRRALRDTAGDDSDDDTDESPPLPEDWACWEWTADQVAVVVGGDRRAEAADRLQSSFRFAEVEWDSDVQGTKLATIAERVRRGSVGMVIFLARLSSHGAQSVLLEACKDASVPFIRVERGYGVTAVRLAIEQLHGADTLTA